MKKPQPLNHPSLEARFLACAISEDRAWQDVELTQLWKQLGDDACFNVACANDAQSIVGCSLERVLGTAELTLRWRDAIETLRKRNGAYLAMADVAANALHQRGVPLVLLKNSGIARGLLDDYARSPMSDVDALVESANFETADRVLRDLGFKLDVGHLEVAHSGRLNRALIGFGRQRGWLKPTAETESDSARRSGGTEYKVELPTGGNLHFELQWRPVAGRWIQPSQEPKAEDLLRRSVPIAGSPARMLSPTDNLLQVCLHTAKHSFVRAPGFRLHTDVDRIVRYSQVDWDKLVRQARSTQVTTAVYFSLLLPARLLRTPVPEEVLSQLSPAGWKRHWIARWLLRVGLLNGQERKWSKLGYIVFNLLLYDTVGGVWRAIVPSTDTIVKRYGVARRYSLAYWYLVRVAELLFCRAKT